MSRRVQPPEPGEPDTPPAQPRRPGKGTTPTPNRKGPVRIQPPKEKPKNS